jgi:Putative  PD-(D/E)XK family member, (DUF4420)
MTISEQDWEQLEADRHARGVAVRRVYPESAHDIFIAVRHPDNCRMLTLRVPPRDADDALRRVRALPRTRGLELQLARLPDDGSELRVVLTDGGLREVFNPLAGDIAAAAQAAPGPAAAVLAAASRFEHWRRMLERLDGTGLTPEARRGLFGELRILRGHLLPALPAAEAVAAWTGPAAANQDFQLPAAAIEVKATSAKEPQTLMISNERELDPHGAARLILACLSLDERRGGTGESLNTAVGSARAAVPDTGARSLLDDLLVRAGYLQSQRDLYDEPRYTVRRECFWHVTGDFPRITEADLRPGVGDCRYRISTAGLDQYLMTAGQVGAVIIGGAPNE